jgi:branched-chain amino acid transport system substrate-binding protein
MDKSFLVLFFKKELLSWSLPMKPYLLAPLLLAFTLPAQAQIKIGAILSITGPTAAQGVGYRGAFDFFPTEIAGQKIEYIIRDDAADPSNAVTLAKKLITEDKVDIIIGPSITTTTLPVSQIANEAKIPIIAVAPLIFKAKDSPWTFDDTQPVPLMMNMLVGHMKAHSVKTIGFIGYSDTWGDQNFGALKADAPGAGMEIVDDERYARTDTSVMGQVLKVMSKHPDAVMLGGSATPGALPNIGLSDRGFKGQIYNNAAVVTSDYIKVGGPAVEGCIAVTGPIAVYDQLPDANPIKAVGTGFMTKWEAAHGAGNRNAFAGYSFDAMRLTATAIPIALKKAQPGTPEFRAALRDALEQSHEVVGTQGVYNMTPDDHNGVDLRSLVLVQVHNGAWTYVQ